ncbi:hypothetical protein NKOR_08410 [Candidatus Nitrosopumilus koreensis AR1]|uniref:Uncharacterized protein n=1 Tax=Candidatus Nitrosopumilus koreensis AR1 TaxID=1229908 RepID=K0BAS1_9ARCH|nr:MULTISPECIES: hypothetical protein [Nitrosopumilus]AFS81541.1 hypothetical protein NKOR_08410 [Candidatus Nitrosopumilus koreensis AR1]
MNNEIGRKITSLTLMTIMIAGGLTFAVPGVMPAAHAANANLFVSAENSQFDNYMSGPQVIEVVVIDSDINDTDEAKGEPDVTVNGKKLRMLQAVDGNWYGYFADRDQAQIADSTATTAGSGLDFGAFCSAASGTSILGFSTSETNGIAVPITVGSGNGTQTGSSSGGTITSTCNLAGLTGSTANGTNNVVREAKDPNAGNTNVNRGQIGLTADDAWPFVQLYTLNPTGNVVVQYNKGGGVQSTTLTFDTVDQFAELSLDRAVYPRLAQVHATVTDLWLNIDPTDEDSWTFATNVKNTTSSFNVDTFYQVFDENGASGGSALSLRTTLSDLMCEDNCVLKLNTDAQNSGTKVLTIQDNDDTVLDQLNSTASTNNASAFGITNETAKLGIGSIPVTLTEQGPNSGVFGTYDESDKSVLKITDNAKRGTSASIDYNETPQTILVGFDFASIDIQPVDDEWTSGEEIPVVIVDADQNKNSRADEDLDLDNPSVTLIPALKTGDPFTIGEVTTAPDVAIFNVTERTIGSSSPAAGDQVTYNLVSVSANHNNITSTAAVDTFSQRAIISQTANTTAGFDTVIIDLETTMEELQKTIKKAGSTGVAFNFFNYNVESFGGSDVTIFLINQTTAILADNDKFNGTSNNAFLLVDNSTKMQDYVSLNGLDSELFTSTNPSSQNLGLVFEFNVASAGHTTNGIASIDDKEVIVADFFSFGFTDDGVQAGERFANQIIRIEAEETGDNTSTFEGSLEYIMVNQINIQDADTFAGITPIADDPSFIVIEDLTDEDAPRVNYNDLGADGVVTPVSDQEEAPSHSGVVSFNQDSYKIADTVVITLEDLDLNVDSDLIDIFTVVEQGSGKTEDMVGSKTTQTLSFGELGRLLDVTFDDVQWETPDENTCTSDGKAATATSSLEDVLSDTGLGATGFTLIETGKETGVFVGDFQIPSFWCRNADTTTTGSPGQYESTTGLDIEVNYVDFRDASGEIVEVGDSAGVRANTGSVSLDRTVYPVPFGTVGESSATANASPNGRSVFPIHATGISGTIDSDEELPSGDLTIHVRINDPDFDVNPSGEDVMNQDDALKISVIRGSSKVVLGYAGASERNTGLIDVGDNNSTSKIRSFGEIDEIAPDAGIYELDVDIKFTDGPASTTCANHSTLYAALDGTSGTADTNRFDAAAPSGTEYCILQGDILQVEYTDPADASGSENTVTDSATFDLRNGVLQSDKSVYIIGSDMILTLIEPDLDLDNDAAETYDLDLIEWDSDAATTTMGNKGVSGAAAAFDPEPTDFRETGDSTGIFQIVIEIPDALDGDNLERGEEIVLEYTDWGPSGSDYVGDEDEDVNLTIYTSNFGATVELDQKVYTWTDKVYITIVAPDHNFDSDLVDEIGNTDKDPIKVSTRGHKLNNYKLVETGTDTGIFTGEVILTGFSAHDADGDGNTGDVTGTTTGSGPTGGFLATDDDDGLTVSFEFSEDETIVGSALIRWNIGEVQWLEASYPASGTGVVRIIDPDMNLDPEAVDNFDVDVWSDSDAGGIDLTVTETNEATGIFEGTVFFTTLDESSGHRLRVSEGDTVTAEYEDNTLPDPYTTADELDITATSLIGTVVPPLERAPAANLRTVDAFGNSLDSVSVDQQVQISADLANGQDREQPFAYLVQIQDANGVTVSLAWITGSLSAGQSFSPALSWIPTQAGTYTATAFVWESVDNPTALSPPVSTTINVR